MNGSRQNELTAPLGLDPRPEKRVGRLLRAAGAAATTTAALVLGGAFVATALYGDPRGGRPAVRVAITTAPLPAAPSASGPPTQAAERAGADAVRRDGSTVEAESGVSVVRPNGAAAPGSIVIRVPDEEPARVTPADPRLVERTRTGLLPRIGPAGLRPLDAYARPAGELPGGARPAGRVAVVVGGLGIGTAATEAALARLPAAVTLAFAPYGQDLERHAARARASGHEIVLQVPMEPFDYPDSDPGPHTLLAAAKPTETLEHLHWSMGRFTGYVGIMNYMGGRLTSDDRALLPILQEAGRRGLGFLDDGSSSRSLVTALAGATPAARADLVLDAVPRADLIDKALARLEALAASGRVVVATASAFPVTIERIARWQEGLAARGILLVPVSAALARTAPVREAAAR